MRSFSCGFPNHINKLLQEKNVIVDGLLNIEVGINIQGTLVP